MIGPIIAFWAMGAPAGYLAGDVFRTKNALINAEYLPWLSAAFPPLAAVLAVVAITQAEVKEKQ